MSYEGMSGFVECKRNYKDHVPCGTKENYVRSHGDIILPATDEGKRVLLSIFELSTFNFKH
jgi:hypothetical protein